jgi:hypothetical protein
MVIEDSSLQGFFIPRCMPGRSIVSSALARSSLFPFRYDYTAPSSCFNLLDRKLRTIAEARGLSSIVLAQYPGTHSTPRTARVPGLIQIDDSHHIGSLESQY